MLLLVCNATNNSIVFKFVSPQSGGNKKSLYELKGLLLGWRPYQDSNLDLKFRKLPFYPLNYKAITSCKDRNIFIC